MLDDSQRDFGPIGDRVSGNYQLTTLIGRGVSSLVYDAYDALLSRRVAIKIVDDPNVGPEALLHEARALAAIRHPGLPVVYGVGSHDGWTFLVLERVYGVTLEEHLDQGRGRPMALDEALAILGPVGETLAAVHAAGMAHRDLRPANVTLAPGRTVLLDFGVAARAPRTGTRRYTAPEVVAGAVAGGNAHLVDVYAFGAIAYEMLAGGPPFESDTAAPPPHLGSVRPDLPHELTELVLACMARSPLDRPNDMQAVVWELRNLGRKPATMPWEVLIVDDDEDGREGLASSLKERGFRTRVASDGRDALDLIRRTGWRPSVILLDLAMPVMDGYQFLAIKGGDPQLDGIPVLLVTAQAADEARRFPSVRGVVAKPLSMPSLFAQLGEVCRSITAAP